MNFQDLTKHLKNLKKKFKVRNFKKFDKKDLTTKINDLKKQTSTLITVDQHVSTKKAVVKLSCEKETEITLKLSYRVKQCSWTPIYDVRVVGSEDEFNISYFAQVSQSSGENWEDTQISLSTADPNVGAEPPVLGSLVLNFYTPPQVYYSSYGKESKKSKSAPKRKMKKSYEMEEKKMDFMLEEDEEEMEEEREMSQPSAKVDKGSTSTNFVIERKVSIPSDGFSHKISIASLSLKSELSHYCVPKFDSNVFLKVKATNTSDYPLLPGEM
jgi:uncharacterized protein (TIGR02231 family)